MKNFDGQPSFLAEPQPRPAANWGKKTAVLLVNLGTPDGTDYWSMRRYLGQFLSDRRVIEVNRVLWWVILNLIILTIRPFKSGKAYAKIWDRAHDASPLRVITIKQAAKLAGMLGAHNGGVTVDWAMRYGTPSIGARMAHLQATGHGRILVAPLYPQYAAATTGSVMDDVARYLLRTRWQPSVNTLPPYYDHPLHIDALAKQMKREIASLGWVPDVVVASFHGLPLEYCQKGDVYYCHSHKTARLLAEKLKVAFCKTVEEVQKSTTKMPLLLTFQSRFGKQVWLQPYTDFTLEKLAAAGYKKVAVVCPGFAADCVETLEEIAVEGRHSFVEAGGTHFAALPCLNDSAEGMAMLAGLVQEQLKS